MNRDDPVEYLSALKEAHSRNMRQFCGNNCKDIVKENQEKTREINFKGSKRDLKLTVETNYLQEKQNQNRFTMY